MDMKNKSPQRKNYPSASDFYYLILNNKNFQ